jgi:hypothetical protein
MAEKLHLSLKITSAKKLLGRVQKASPMLLECTIQHTCPRKFRIEILSVYYLSASLIIRGPPLSIPQGRGGTATQPIRYSFKFEYSQSQAIPVLRGWVGCIKEASRKYLPAWTKLAVRQIIIAQALKATPVVASEKEC